MQTYGFETTLDDVDTIMQRHGVPLDESATAKACRLLEDNAMRLQRTALLETELERQTQCVLCELEELLIKGALLSEKTQRLFALGVPASLR